MLSTPANPWETSDIYSRLQISAIQMNIQETEFLRLSLLLCLYFITITLLISFPRETLSIFAILRSHKPHALHTMIWHLFLV